MIVQTALHLSRSEEVVVVGEDTDLIVLLHHARSSDKRIFFRSDRQQSKQRYWDILKVQKSIGFEISNAILFIHAISGCDTTSALFNIGKGGAWKLARKLDIKAKEFLKAAEVFCEPQADAVNICKSGQRALLLLYGADPNGDINQLRKERFHQKVAASSSFVHPKSLPPTAAAVEQHSLRVYNQVQEWKFRRTEPLKWGWKLEGDRFLPCMTDADPAPPELMKIIKCKCRTACSSNNCSCRKNGFSCTPACSECKGVTCQNTDEAAHENDDEYDDSNSNGDELF
jgi:5'-3' exonuclease